MMTPTANQDQPAAGTPNANTTEADSVDRHLLELLVCPITLGELRYDRAANELISEKASLAFPIRNGIPIMLEDEARVIEE